MPGATSRVRQRPGSPQNPLQRTPAARGATAPRGSPYKQSARALRQGRSRFPAVADATKRKKKGRGKQALGKTLVEESLALPATTAFGETMKRRRARAHCSDDATTVWYAAKVGELERLEAILHGRGRDMAMKRDPENGYTALHYAARGGRLECAKLLLDFGADVNARGTDSRTPLHLAAGWGTQQVVVYLMGSGADATWPDATGVTAARLAEQAERFAIADVIDRWLPVGITLEERLKLTKPPPLDYENEKDEELANCLRLLQLRRKRQTYLLSMTQEAAGKRGGKRGDAGRRGGQDDETKTGEGDEEVSSFADNRKLWLAARQAMAVGLRRLASMYLDRDRPYEACEVLEDAVREVRELYGANSFEDADVLNHLGEAEVAAGRRQRAAAAFQGARESLSYWQIVNGGGPEVSEAEHLASAPSEQALAARVLDKRLTISEGRNLVKLGEHMKAEALLRRHLAFEEDEHRTEMGGFSLAIVPAIDLLAYVKMNQGTEAGYAESRALYERALAVTEVQVRDDNLQLLRRYENLGMACFRARDWPASQAWFRRADALLKAVGREDDDEDVQRVVRNISQAARMEHEQHLREQQAKLDEKRKAKEKKLRAMGLM